MSSFWQLNNWVLTIIVQEKFETPALRAGSVPALVHLAYRLSADLDCGSFFKIFTHGHSLLPLVLNPVGVEPVNKIIVHLHL